MRFRPQRPRFDCPGPQLVQLQPQPVPVAFRIPLDQVELFHGVKQAVNGRFVQAQSRGELSHPQGRPVVAHVNQNAKGLLQGLAGASLAPRTAPLPSRCPVDPHAHPYGFRWMTNCRSVPGEASMPN